MKRLYSAASMLIAIIMIISLSVFVSAKPFKKQATYNNNFTDVPENAWFNQSVKTVYEFGFMNGLSDTAFNPNGNVTVAEAITLTSRIHATYNDNTINTISGEKWYDMYVNYAVNNGIITDNQFDNYTRHIKRYEMAVLLHDAMPAGYYTPINNVTAIPDVSSQAPYFNKIITLYNAGIILGSDDYGTFYPETNIKRSECAAIISRVALPENRVKGSLAIETVKLYASDGRTKEVPAANVEAEVAVGWSTEPYVLMYAPDGRTKYVLQSKVADEQKSGWSLEKPKVQPTKIYTNASVSLEVGASYQLEYSFAPENVSDTSVTWSSDNTSVATVNSSGKVTATGAGTANIKVTASNGVSTACKVTVSKPTPSYTHNGLVQYLKSNASYDSEDNRYKLEKIHRFDDGTMMYVSLVYDVSERVIELSTVDKNDNVLILTFDGDSSPYTFLYGNNDTATMFYGTFMSGSSFTNTDSSSGVTFEILKYKGVNYLSYYEMKDSAAKLIKTGGVLAVSMCDFLLIGGSGYSVGSIYNLK